MKAIRRLYDTHKDQILPAVKFARACIRDVTKIAAEPGVFDYIDLGFTLKETFNNHYASKGSNGYFQARGWPVIVQFDYFEQFLRDFLSKKLHTNLAKVVEQDGVIGWTARYNDVVFGWTQKEQSIQRVYAPNSNVAQQFLEVFRTWFWNQEIAHWTHGVAISTGRVGENITAVAYEQNKNIIITDVCQDLTGKMSKFFDNKINRSILFYGPPGSGKTNLAMAMCHNLKFNYLRFPKLQENGELFIRRCLEMFNPQAIIIDDIDSIQLSQKDQFLKNLEILNSVSLLLATANRISDLDDAIIRPERFDLTYKISTLEQNVIISILGNDPDLLNKVHTWPAAFINELGKRIQAWGREEALASINDLEERAKKIQKEKYNKSLANSEYVYVSADTQDKPQALSGVLSAYPETSDRSRRNRSRH